jgi:hypothetical protein
MFRLVPQDAGEGPLLRCDHPLTALDFRRVSERLGIERQRARKRGLVAARRTDMTTSGSGDWLVTTLDEHRQPIRNRDGRVHTSSVSAERFPVLYALVADIPPTPDGHVFERRSDLEALRLPGPFDIVAPWGQRQQGLRGWLLLDGGEVSAITDDQFSDSYVVLSPPATEAPWT